MNDPVVTFKRPFLWHYYEFPHYAKKKIRLDKFLRWVSAVDYNSSILRPNNKMWLVFMSLPTYMASVGPLGTILTETAPPAMHYLIQILRMGVYFLAWLFSLSENRLVCLIIWRHIAREFTFFKNISLGRFSWLRQVRLCRNVFFPQNALAFYNFSKLKIATMSPSVGSKRHLTGGQ